MNSTFVTIDKDVLGGTPVFKNSRIPVKTLFDYLESGDSLEIFLEDFPSLKRDFIISFLDHAKELTLTI